VKMVVKKQGVGDDWPPELWYFDRSGFECRHEWLCACMDFAKSHGYNALAVNRLMVNRRPLGTELALELTPECRQKVRPVRRPPG
jgi:hypothetical protein